MVIKNKKKLLSIVIKSEHIKLCEVSKNGKSLKVHSAVTIGTPKGAVADGLIEDMESLEQAIRQIIAKNGISTKDVIFSIVSGKIATKEVIIPEVKDNRIADIVAANASEYFPVEIDEYIIKHTILERFTDGDIGKIRLQLVAAPKKMVETYYALAKKLEFHIETIDYSGNSIYQLLNEQIGNEFCTVIDIEGEGTVVSIFENNVLKMQRTIPYGRTLLIETVMEKYELTTEEEVRKKLYEDKILNISLDTDDVTDSLSYLVNGIKRITDYYISRNGGKPFEKAYVLGDAVTIPGLLTLLSNEMGTDLLPIIRFGNVTCVTGADTTERNITEYTSAIGALLAPIDITSVLQEDLEKKNGSSMRTMVMLLILAAVASAALVAMPLIDVWSYEDKMENTQKNIDRLIYVEDIVDDYYVAKDKLSDAAAFQIITSNNNDYLHIFLQELEKKMPSDIAFNGMSVSSGSVSVSGTAASKSSLAKLIQELNSIESVANVFIANETEVMDNTGAITVSFSLTCTFSAMTDTKPDEEGETETGNETATDENGEQESESSGSNNSENVDTNNNGNSSNENAETKSENSSENNGETVDNTITGTTPANQE